MALEGKEYLKGYIELDLETNDDEIIIIPGNYNEIEDYCFNFVKNVEYIELELGIRRIGYLAFRDMELLEYIVIPVGVDFIDNYAFYNCPNLTTIIYRGTKAEFENIELASYWLFNSPITKVSCSDGTIKL